jgi:hypothetical protein
MQKKSIIKFNEYHNTGPDPAPQKPQLTKIHKIRASKNDEEYSLALGKMHNVINQSICLFHKTVIENMTSTICVSANIEWTPDCCREDRPTLLDA